MGVDSITEFNRLSKDSNVGSNSLLIHINST